ncbi:hypothetical protein [Vulcanisaeta distributa]|uniref:hypothetical protein n=1 Tax=Vulcanisaeta distributa TaxID=164451 RepID=UPI001FB33792|nr:hypothetical protein [Vulcanisaeta distributa]
MWNKTTKRATRKPRKPHSRSTNMCHGEPRPCNSKNQAERSIPKTPWTIPHGKPRPTVEKHKQCINERPQSREPLNKRQQSLA